MNIRNIPMPVNKYNIKCPLLMNPTRIVVHNTANDASAENEIKYMTSNNKQVSFHVAVDDKEVITCIPFNRNAWHAGDGRGTGNTQGLGIEICYSKSGGDRFTKAERLTAEYIASLLKQYGWGINKVTKHQDYSKKYCPHRTLDVGWQRFLDMVQGYLTPARYNLTRLLQQGIQGDDVKHLQSELNNRGFRDKNGKLLLADGDFGANTHHAVDDFQRNNGLTVKGQPDGKVGKNTAHKLNWLYKGA